MDRDNANATRLRVNRIALIQQIDVQELIPKLVRARIISADDDVQTINQGTSRIDRARRLIDCLLQPPATGRGTKRVNRPVNWYLLFRNILLENPYIYGKLVTTLDNTVIRIPNPIHRSSKVFDNKPNVNQEKDFRENVNEDLSPTSEAQQTKISNTINNDQKQITKIEFDRYAMNKVVIEGSFQKAINNLTYHSQVPEHLFNQLSHSIHAYDRDQFDVEQKTLDDMRRLELMTNLIKQEKSLANQNIFDTQIVDSLLANLLHQHYFYKYFNSLSSIYGIHYDEQLFQSFKNSLEKQKDLSKIIDKGFQFYHFLYNYGRYELCRQIIECIIQSLTKQVKQRQPIIWTYLFRACCALIQVHNQNLEIKEAWARFDAANEIAENLKTTGIEIAKNDYAWLYSVTSQTAFEDANFDACIQYSYRGLKLVDKDNHSLIVDLLCSLTQGLMSKWIMNKSQATAVMAVQYAAKYCGRNSPKFICALQQLVQYSNEFIQDLSSVELAQYTYDRAQTVYGYESLVVAHCHRALSKSLITLTSISQSRHTIEEQSLENNENSNPSTPMEDSPPCAYLHHAQEAYRIAQDWFGVEDHTRLYPFKMSLSHALQARIAVNLIENKTVYFEDAIELLHRCLLLVQDIFGPMSFKVAQVRRLQSATYLSQKMYDEAEQELNICLQIYKLCLPPNSFHYLVTKASLGLLYKQQGDYEQALAFFQSIADVIDTKTQSFRWINMILESLIECYSHFEEDEEDSPRAKSAADKIRSELYEWRHANIKRINLINLIHQEPTRSLQQFVQDSTKFQETTNRLHALIHTQHKAKNRALLSTMNAKTHQET